MQKKTFVPKSKTIAKELMQKIHDGIYTPGEKMESIRVLAERYGVGRQIILSAFNVLAKQNFIYTTHGGTFINPQIKCGLYYRIGFFVNDIDISSVANVLLAVEAHVRRAGFQLISGTNYEIEFTAEDWLNTAGSIDGIIITGILNDETLVWLKQHKRKYVVLGNYDIAPEHPQVRLNVREIVAAQLLPFLNEHPEWQKIAVISGFPAFPTDAQLLEGSRDAIRQSGREVDEAILWHERGDGYAALSKIFRHGVPDAIIIWGGQGPGLQHYFDRHPKLKRPAIITKENYADELTDGFPKYILPANSPQISQWVQEAVYRLINQIKENGS